MLYIFNENMTSQILDFTLYILFIYMLYFIFMLHHLKGKILFGNQYSLELPYPMNNRICVS